MPPVWSEGESAPSRATRSSASRLLRSLSLPLHDLLTTIFPADCLLCGEPLLRSARLPVCESCLHAPRGLAGSRCHVCGDPFGMESERIVSRLNPTDQRCTPCRLVPPAFERAVAAATYDAEMRELLHLLKYSGLRELARPLGRQLAAAIASLAPEFRAETANADIFIVPVPLATDRRRERGFNQAEALADAARLALRRLLSDVPFQVVPNALRRTRATASQFELNPRQRRQNLRDAFAADPASSMALDGRAVLLIDDIFTTGATARECAAALRRAGARRVWVATIARAEPESVALWDGGSANA